MQSAFCFIGSCCCTVQIIALLLLTPNEFCKILVNRVTEIYERPKIKLIMIRLNQKTLQLFILLTVTGTTVAECCLLSWFMKVDKVNRLLFMAQLSLKWSSVKLLSPNNMSEPAYQLCSEVKPKRHHRYFRFNFVTIVVHRQFQTFYILIYKKTESNFLYTNFKIFS